MKLQSASKEQIRRITLGTGVLDFLLLILLYPGNTDNISVPMVLISMLIGSFVGIVNFTLLCLTVEYGLEQADSGKRSRIFQLSYHGRMLFQAAWVLAACFLPGFHFIAGAVPLLFPKMTILYLRTRK